MKASPSLLYSCLLMVSLFFGTPAFGAPPGQSTLEQSFQIRPDGVVEVDNPGGNVRVHTWEKDYVHLTAQKLHPPGQPVYFSDLTLAASESTIVIGCYPTNAQTRIDLTLFVPRQVRVQIGTDSEPDPSARPAPSSRPGTHRRSPPPSYQPGPGHPMPSPMPGPSGRIAGDRQQGYGRSSGGLGPVPGRSDDQKRAGEGSMGIGVRVIPPLPTNSDSVNWPDPNSSDRDSYPPTGSASGATGDRNLPGGPSSQTGPTYPTSSPLPGTSGRIAGDRQQGYGRTSGGLGPVPGRSGDDKQAGEGSMGIGVRAIPPLRTGPDVDHWPSQRTSSDRDPFAVFKEDPFFTSDPLSDKGSGRSGRGHTSLGWPPSDSSRSASRRAEPRLRSARGPLPGEAAAGAGDTSTDSADDPDAPLVLRSELVNLNASVRDRSGRAISGLSKVDFQVYEDGVPQEVAFFTPVSAPFNLVLMLDLSGSTREKIDVIKRAATRFIDTLSPGDRVAVVTFTHQTEIISHLTTDRAALRERIGQIQATSDGTALYEALWRVMTEVLRGTRGQRNAIVLLTDGVDNSISQFSFRPSLVSFDDLLYRVEETDLIMYPIYLDTEREVVYKYLAGSPESYALARERLQALAEMTGGAMFRAERVEDLDQTYEQVASELRTVYSLGYYPTNSRRDGTWRQLRVRVKGRSAVVRTRAGYYAR